MGRSVSLLRKYIRELLSENTLALGMCFPFAIQKAEEWFADHYTPPDDPEEDGIKHPDLGNMDKFKVVHGKVTDKWKNPPKQIVHAWVEVGDLIFDDQTRITKPDGIPKEVYYDMFQPEVVEEFTAEQALTRCTMSGYEGPWNEELKDIMRTRDAWINESRFKQMSKAKFTGLKQALLNSTFLDADPEGDLDDEGWSSEAAKVLRDTLNDYFDDNFGPGEINSHVKVDMMSTDPAEGKDSVLKSGTYFYDDFHNIEIILANIEDGSTFRNIESAHQKIYEVIMHELLHMQQFLKFSKGEPTIEKWNQFKDAYEKAGGSSGMGADYFFFDDIDGPSELETFSFQMATELVDSLGKDQAIIALQKQYPDYEIIRNNSASFRNIERRSNIDRPEFREMLKRAKQYAKRM